MATKVALHLSFTTDQNKTVRVSIPSPKLPIDASLVDAAAKAIVDGNVFAFAQGKIVAAQPAQEVQTDTTTVS